MDDDDDTIEYILFVIQVFPVGTQRRFNVQTTSLNHSKRSIDVKTLSKRHFVSTGLGHNCQMISVLNPNQKRYYSSENDQNLFFIA